MNIKNRIFAVIAVDMLFTNYLYRLIYDVAPFKLYNTFNWVVDGALFVGLDNIKPSYWWMWVFIIIAYFIFTYKTEGGELSKN